MMFVANCPQCGRFASATSRKGYDGTWNQIWVMTYCKKCGKKVQTLV